MQTVSNLYLDIFGSKNYYTETRVLINSVAYTEEDIMKLCTSRKVFAKDSPVVGCAVAGEIDLDMLMPRETIPRMAKIQPQVRLVSKTDGRMSEWLPKGVFFIDTREKTENSDNLDILTIHGFDAMLKASVNFPSNTLVWPNTNNLEVVTFIANKMGVGVDARTRAILTRGYKIQLPAQYTMQETLGFIAGMYGGNFIMSDKGELMLITIGTLPPETNYIVTEYDSPITFGGDRILHGWW